TKPCRFNRYQSSGQGTARPGFAGNYCRARDPYRQYSRSLIAVAGGVCRPVGCRVSSSQEVCMISITKILCPVDFFPASDAAVNYAAGLAANYDARIHLLHVITPQLPTAYEYAVDTASIIESLEKNAAEEMKKLSLRAKEAGVHADFEIRIGDVYDE